MVKDEQISTIFKQKKVDYEWAFEKTKPSDRGKWTHSYHRYPAKFIPQIVEKLMDEYINTNEDVSINDPFFGCGTTIVSAISRGYSASGTDINKIAYLMTKVKSTPLDPIFLSKKVNDFLAKIQSLGTNQTLLLDDFELESIIPEKHQERIDYWFDVKTKEKLGKILHLIQTEKKQEIQDFLKVAFSHCLKNCSIWLQSSTKPTRDMNKNIPEPYDILKRHLNKMLRGNKAFYDIVPEKTKQNHAKYLNIVIDDARRQPVKDESVDLIVTSSPYVTSYEYADLHQLSTLWFDLADDLSEYRKEFIGTAHKEYEGKEIRSIIGKNIVMQMKQKNKKLARNIEAYFIDMQEVFDESARILKPGGRCCFVIGNTKLKKVDIQNSQVFAQNLSYSGLVFDRLIKREIHSKLLPQKRDEKTGRFASNAAADTEAYPVEYIVIGKKE